MSMQFTESKYKQYTTEVSGSVLFGTVYKTSTLYFKISSTLDRIEKANCILKATQQIFYQDNQFWSQPDNKSKSISKKNLTFSLKSTDQQPDSQETLIKKFESTKIDKVQENPRDVNQQPIRCLVVPFVCLNKLCNWICFLVTCISKLWLRMVEW